ASPELGDQIVDDRRGSARMLDENRGVDAGGSGKIVVQVAVAQVTEDDIAHARKGGVERLLRPREECRNARDRHADVMLDIGALAFLRVWNMLAQRPQSCRLRFRAGDDGVK